MNVAGVYQVERVLSRTQAAMTVTATHPMFRMRLALELVWPAYVDSTIVQQFLHDARLANQLRSVYAARIVDAGALDDGGFFLASEYFDGDTLAATLAQRGSLAANEAATYIIQICEALAEAHTAGLVHRDLDLAHCIVWTTGIKVTGFARLAPLLDAPLAADPRTDIFALGCMLFELLSGKSPYTLTVAALRERSPHLPAGMLMVIERCLERDPARRFQRVQDLASALAVFTAPVPHREAPRFTAANLVAVED